MSELQNIETIFGEIEGLVKEIAHDIEVVVKDIENDVVCFTAGTLIRTVKGDVAVEALAVGDLVVTSSGEQRPVRWLGHRTIECSRHSRPDAVLPIRITKGALGANCPTRDLLVSPGHAICINVVDEILVPASALVNDATVVQADMSEVTYWHVELETHDILIANGCATESYMDIGNRSFFVENGMVSIDTRPDAVNRPTDSYCRPFVEAGPTIDAIRERMRHRATTLGWSQVETSKDDLHLVVDGVRIDPSRSSLKARFVVPASAADVWLVSNSFVPYHVGNLDDRRRLGVFVAGMTIDDGLGARVTIALDDARIGTGFQPIEPGSCRWTDGRAHLPADLWKDCQGSFFLSLELSSAVGQRWVEPAKTAVSGIAAAA